MSFNFTPVNGLRDMDAYPTTPASEGEAREQFQELFDQVKNYMNNSLAPLDGFTKSLVANGYQKLPGGLIVQWGSLTLTLASGVASAAVTFPIPFTTACFGMWGNPKSTNGVNPTYANVNCTDPTLANFNIYARNLEGAIGTSITAGWLAIGY